MAAPSFTSISPASGSTLGGELLVIKGADLASRIRISLGGLASPRVIGVASTGEEAWARSPGGVAGAADLLIENLDESGEVIPGETLTVPGAFDFEIPDLKTESNATALTRSLLKLIKGFVPEGHSGPDSIAVDYTDDPEAEVRVLTFSKLPGIALAGPRFEKNLFYRRPDRRFEGIEGEPDQSLIRGPSLTYDLIYALTIASRSKIQTLNLLNVVSASLHRRGRASILGEAGEWLLNVSPERTLPPREGVHLAYIEIRIVGFNLDEGIELSRSRTVEETQADVDGI